MLREVFLSHYLPVGPERRRLSTERFYESISIFRCTSSHFLSHHTSVIFLFSPARGWRGWGAAWRVPSGCWHLSSCPAYSQPAPLWRWDRTPASPLATVGETQKYISDSAKYKRRAAKTQWQPLASLTPGTSAPGRINALSIKDICSAKEPGESERSVRSVSTFFFTAVNLVDEGQYLNVLEYENVIYQANVEQKFAVVVNCCKLNMFSLGLKSWPWAPGNYDRHFYHLSFYRLNNE